MSELAGLRRGHVDILRGRVDIAEICVEVTGHLIFASAQRARAGRRSLTLPRSVVAALGRPPHQRLRQQTPQRYVFTAPEGGPLRVPALRRRQWVPAVQQAGLVPLRPHDLRHTAVALWIASGANLLEVSRRAGHTSTSFTLDRYGHLFPEADGMLAERLEQLVSQHSPHPGRVIATLEPSGREFSWSYPLIGKGVPTSDAVRRLLQTTHNPPCGDPRHDPSAGGATRPAANRACRPTRRVRQHGDWQSSATHVRRGRLPPAARTLRQACEPPPP